MAEIKETKEFLVGLNELALALIPILKDGVQITDAVVLFEKMKSDAVFAEKLMAAYEGMSAMGTEIGDVSMAEGIELVMIQAQYVPKILAAAKTQAVVA